MYNALIRNGGHYYTLDGVLGRVLLTDLTQVPSSWFIRFRGSEIKRSTNLEELMCGPDEPLQLFKPTRDSKTLIVIKTLTEKIFELKVSLVDTVEDVKMQIEFLQGIPQDMQRLLFAGRQLENWPSLMDIGITNGSTIYLVLRLLGGGSCLSTVDLEGKQLAGRGVPATYPWNGYTIGLNLYGVCPNQDCVSNTIKNGSNKITVHAKYGLIEMTRESNKFQCPACSVGRFCPTNFVVSYARSLFRFKKYGWDQPVKSVLMESLGLDDEYKTFDAGNGNSDYDFIEIQTVGRDSSPYNCVKCDLSCGSGETVLNCGHAYHRHCFRQIEECIVCKAETFDSIQDFLRNEKGLRKRKTDRKEVRTTKRARCDAKDKSEAAFMHIWKYSYQRNLWEIRREKGLLDRHYR